MMLDAAPTPHESINGNIASPPPTTHHSRPSTPRSDTPAAPSDAPHPPTNGHSRGAVSDHDGTSAPSITSSKKRKFGDLEPRSRSASRAVSPPWRAFATDGPTQFTADGKRRSARTNAVPLQLQPPSDKRKTRAAHESSLQLRAQKAAETPGKGVNVSKAHPEVLSKQPIKATTTMAASTRKPSQRLSQKVDSVEAAAAVEIPVAKEHNDTSKHAQALITSPSSPKVSRSNRPPVMSEPAQPQLSSPERKKRDIIKDEPPVHTPARPSPRLRLKLPKIEIIASHPLHIPRPSRFATLEEVLAHYDQAEKEQGLERETNALDELEKRVVEKPKQTPDELALREAQIRLDIVKAGQSGGCLSRENCSLYLPDDQQEPSRQYSHVDHLWAHGAYFKTLLDREKGRHREMAKKTAHACVAKWKEKQPPTEEEMQKQADDFYRLIYKQTVKDMQRKWELVTAEIEKRRLALWIEAQELTRDRNMHKLLEKTTAMLERRKQVGFEDDSPGLDTGFMSDADDGESSDEGREQSDDDGALRDEHGSDVMSTSDSDSARDESLNGHDDDDKLSPEALRAKYGELPDLELPNLDEADESDDEDKDEDEVEDHLAELMDGEGSAMDTPGSEINYQGLDVSSVPLDQVDDALLDESDESTDMDSDMGSSEEETGSDEESENDGSGQEDDAEDVGLLGFLGKQERRLVQDEEADQDVEMEDSADPSQLATPPADMDHNLLSHPHLNGIQDKSSPTSGQEANHSSEPSAHDDTTAAPTEADSTTSVDVDETIKPAMSAEETPQPSRGVTTKIPSLLRGTLREYQHYGLDWLAKLYVNQTNGILADEMGLGKTIQTIALLAHLAEEHQIWGPHLIVVPTSVILNWEMEFKKFLPGFRVLSYYGSIEERAQKRRGWANPDNYNVVITSYQLILKDLLAIRVPEWHYLILDEAHNIKNFNSQRYQAMIRLKTHARLLLTGTPLQNSIQELWSLLTFLTAGQDGQGMGDLDEFTQWFRRPIDEIFVDGRNKLGVEAQAVVDKLHHSLRPYILRRMKAQVEKQLPGKYEHTVMCRLSKRQRQLYDAFMSRTETKAQLSSGNMISVSQALMSLRKVCNHPDLFEERPIVTSFTMRKPWSKMPMSVAANFEIKDLLIRRSLMEADDGVLDLSGLDLNLACREQLSKYHTRRSHQLRADVALKEAMRQQSNGMTDCPVFDGSTLDKVLSYQNSLAALERLDKLRRYTSLTEQRTSAEPIYGSDLAKSCTIYRDSPSRLLSHTAGVVVNVIPTVVNPTDVPTNAPTRPEFYYLPRTYEQFKIEPASIKSIESRGESFNMDIQKFAFVTPNAVAHDILPYMMPVQDIKALRNKFSSNEPDPFHESRVRMSIAFPDRRLLQYDCGKLQQLAILLRRLQTQGSRALIFTQMTSVLDILEQFLNIHGYKYLRLDGSTRIEARQEMTERFNRDARIDAFILSSRSGGIGLNLTGADTVIFYDLDWNPQMDKQCQDRAHRIGQTRDVHIYKLVSEHTIEVNILKKSNQKRMLDEVVIQEGEFTTDYFNRADDEDRDDDEIVGDDVAGAAVDRVFGGQTDVTKVLEAAEDVVDVEAARAQQRALQIDDADFGEETRPRGTPKTSVPPTPAALTDGVGGQSVVAPDGTEMSTTLEAAQSGLVTEGVEEEQQPRPHIDDYMLRFMEMALRGVAFVPPVDKSRRGRLDKNGRDRSHRPKR